MTLTGYFGELQQASFNGVQFFTRSNSTTVGRRNAEHIYPFRDTPWMEDVGRKARKYHIVGFLIGDDVISQRNAMQAALETPGAGTLVHPTYGRISVSALEECSFEEDMTHGRVIEMRLVFEESGQKIFPSVSVSTVAAVIAACLAAMQAALDDFSTQVAPMLSGSSAVTAQMSGTTGEWTTIATAGAANATSAFNMASAMPGPYGRFFGAATGTGFGSIVGAYIPPSVVSSDFSDLLVTASSDYASMNSAIGDLYAAGADFTSALAYGLAVAGVVSAIISALANPYDAVSFFTQLNNFAPSGAQAQAQIVVADILRRAAAVGLAQASSAYQPSSQNDAATLLGSVVGILDNEITIAGDEGLDETFYALTALRIAVAQDLSSRGAVLPSLQTFTTNVTMPALVLAYQYYDDITRTDQLIASADAVHPAFMPLSFTGLST